LWKEQLKEVIHQYRDEDIYNVYETALFYKFAPTKHWHFKVEWCSRGKCSKEQINV
jgi:hypothetical protein